MRYFTQPFVVLWKAYFFVVFLLILVLMYPLFWITLSYKKWWPLGLKLQKLYSYLLTTLIGIFVVVKHKNRFPKPPYIICPNHGSYLDIVTMFQAIPHYFVFMGKKEIEQWPLFNVFFTKGMHILVDRKNPVKAAQSFEQGAQEIKKGNAVVIFPEGTIWPFVPKLKPFKNGAFKMAIEQKVPIVPVTFLDNYKLLQTGVLVRTKGRPGLSRVIIHEPIYTDNLNDGDLISLRDKVFNIIQEPLLKNGDK